MSLEQLWPMSADPIEAHADFALRKTVRKPCRLEDVSPQGYCSNCTYTVRSVEELEQLVAMRKKAVLDGQGAPVGPYFIDDDDESQTLQLYAVTQTFPAMNIPLAKIAVNGRTSSKTYASLNAVSRLLCGAPEMYTLLRALEWSATVDSCRGCPMCGAARENGHRRSCDLGNMLAVVCGPTVPMPMEQILYLQELRQRIKALSPKWGPLVAKGGQEYESRFCDGCAQLTRPADCPNPNTLPVRCRACTEKTVR